MLETLLGGEKAFKEKVVFFRKEQGFKAGAEDNPYAVDICELGKIYEFIHKNYDIAELIVMDLDL